MGAGNNQPALNKGRGQRLLIPLARPEEARAIASAIERVMAPITVIHDESRLALNRLEKVWNRYSIVWSDLFIYARHIRLESR